MSDTTNRAVTGLEIAVIGMAGRFPGAANCPQFWDNLTKGTETITFFSDAELEAAGIDKALLINPNYVKAKGIIDQVEYFDASFFGFSPRDAQILDPQIRIFYECVWEALEDAGYNPFTCPDPIGLYAGAAANYLWEAALLTSDTGITLQSQLLVDKEFMTTSISYHLNLKGPSVFIATACSTSLVAIHLASRALLTGECNMALAGGVSLALPQQSGYFYEEGMIMSPDGHCRAFDAQARGTVFGEGAGVVLLKMLKNAVRDGDHIYAVIKGTAANNDGFRKVGYTAPSIEGQTEVIRAAQRIARVEPESISYIETHGTGTLLGDPIEIEALKNAFKTDKKQFCRIGSVKTNIGHLNTAAGITGFIKTVLALKHKQIPPSLHFQTPNPKIDFENSPFVVNTELMDWRNVSKPLRAGVSSFGIGGTNAYIVLEEAPIGAIHESPLQESPLQESPLQAPWRLLLVSAKTETALAAMAENLVEYLRLNPEVALPDVAYTLCIGRAHFPYRRMTVCKDNNDAIVLLSKQVAPVLPVDEIPNLAWLFPGQGSQYLNMGRELFETQPVFQEEFNLCCKILNPILNLDLKTVLYPHNPSGSDHRMIDDSALTHAAIFSVEYALARLLQKWGLKPWSMIGQDIGEYVAACLAGVFSLEDALSLVVSLHLPSIEPSLTFLAKLSRMKLAAPKIPILSSITGDWLSPEESVSPEYWAPHFRNMAKFTAGVGKLLETRPAVLVEIGGESLPGMIQKHPAYHPEKHCVFATMRQPREGLSDIYQLLDMLGKIWLQGIQIDWGAFYSSEHRRRISMPTYPFERQRFWIDNNLNLLRKFGFRPESSAHRRALDDWFYVPTWKQNDLIHQEALGTGLGDILVFTNELDFCVQLIEQLRQTGSRPILAKAGAEFLKESDDCYNIRPNQPEDYRNLFCDLQQSGALPRTIIHLWLVTAVPLTGNRSENPAGFSLPQIETATDLGFYSLIYIAQALGELRINNDLFLKVITNNMQAVTGQETLAPEKALILGPVKIIPQEYPRIKCANIDIEIPDPGSLAMEQLIQKLLQELETPSSEPVVAWRENNRWTLSFEAFQLNKSRGNPIRLRENGIYLITGGMGGIGLTVAELLAKSVRAKLVLTGRSPLPARQDWQRWLQEHDLQDPTSQKIRKIKEFEELRATVIIVNADVADFEQMQTVLKDITAEFGKVDGVIHCAGLADGGVIQLRNRAATDPVLAPKVKGTVVIDELFRAQPLDFFLICSSLSSIIPAVGQVAYTAANGFLDAYAHYKTRRDGTFTVAINWDGWQEVGMAATLSVASSTSILPAEGAEVWRRILDLDKALLSQVIVSTGPLAERYGQWTSLDLRTSQAGLPNKASSRYKRPELPNPYVGPREETEAKLAEIWQEVLGFEKVGVHDNFLELGGDSITALQIIESAKQAGLNISVTDIFTLETIAKIAPTISHSIQGDFKPETMNPQSDSTASSYNPFYNLKDLQQFEIETPETKVLRIYPQTEITSYLCYSLPLCVILADQRLLPWYYEHFIDLFAITDDKDYLKLDYLEPRAAYKEVMYEVYLGYSLLQNETDIIKFIIDKINLGYYVIIHADEFYLPVKSSYHKKHFVHHSIIYGYDNRNNLFLAIGFNAEEIFTQISFAYDPFREAYEQGKLYYRESAPWAENNAVELLKLKDYQEEYPFNMQRFLLKLGGYLAAAGDDSIIFSFMMNKDKVTYGMNVYQPIINHMENFLNRRYTIDYRAIHLLHEHKKGIHNRLKYILERYRVGGALGEMVQEYYGIVADLDLVRRKFMEQNYAFNSRRFNFITFSKVIKESIGVINGVREKETKLLTDIYQQMSQKF